MSLLSQEKVKKLAKKWRDIVLYGSGKEEITFVYKQEKGSGSKGEMMFHGEWMGMPVQLRALPLCSQGIWISLPSPHSNSGD